MIRYLIFKAAELKADRRGQDLLEYALIVAFVATAAISVLSAIPATGNRLNAVIQMLYDLVYKVANQTE